MGTTAIVEHGAPLLGEPLPLELANTTYAVRGRVQDGLRTVGQLASWLGEVRSRLETPLGDRDLREAGDTQLAMTHDLRDSIRRLAQAAVDDLEPDPAVVDRLNSHARSAPRWRELRWDPRPHSETCSEAARVTASLCEIAQTAVDLLAGPRRTDIRSCHGPGCVLYFVKDHPRREWCSLACGNRVRAARHYQRTRQRDRPDPH